MSNCRAVGGKKRTPLAEGACAEGARAADEALAANLSIAFEAMKRHPQFEVLRQRYFSIGRSCSSGSACRSGHAQDSAVLTAMNVAPSWRQSLLRFSLGPWLSDDDLDAVPPLLIRAIDACT